MLALLVCRSRRRRGKPASAPTDAWPTYNGDYTGRRFSTLTQDQRREHQGARAWRGSTACTARPARRADQGDAARGRTASLYFTAPDHVWAVDARTGREIWHFDVEVERRHPHRQPRRRHLRQLAVLRDAGLQSRLARTSRTARSAGTSRSATSTSIYYGSMAPIDRQEPRHRRRQRRRPRRPRLPRIARSRDRRPAVALVRRCRRRRASPGARRWPNEEAMAARRRHDLAAADLRSRAEPDLRRAPAIRSRSSRTQAAQGDNLFTGSIVALNPDTGKMVWYFQVVAARHARLGRDADAGADRRRDQRPAAQAGRAGAAATATSSCSTARPARTSSPSSYVEDQLGEGYRREGAADSRSREGAAVDGALVSPNQGGATNWPPPSFSPRPACSTSAPRAPSACTTSTTRATTRRAGAAPIAAAGRESMLQAIDYKTGKVRWSHKWEGAAARRAC